VETPQENWKRKRSAASRRVSPVRPPLAFLLATNHTRSLSVLRDSLSIYIHRPPSTYCTTHLYCPNGSTTVQRPSYYLAWAAARERGDPLAADSALSMVKGV
jgi:hypothetical protein